MKRMVEQGRGLRTLYLASAFVFLLVGSTSLRAYWPHGCCGDSGDCEQAGYICCFPPWAPCTYFLGWPVRGYCGDAAWNCDLVGHGT
jgi:hypothetical protein